MLLKKKMIAAPAVGVLLMGVVQVLPAHADDSEGTAVEILEQLAVTAPLDQNVLDDVAPVGGTSTAESVVDATVNGQDVLVSNDAALGATLGETTISLPFAETASEATELEPGVIEYDNDNSSRTV